MLSVCSMFMMLKTLSTSAFVSEWTKANSISSIKFLNEIF
jgi:hypothetical protein